MRPRHTLHLFALLALVTPGLATAQTAPQAELRWKFAQGQKFPYATQQETKTRLTIQGNTVETSLKQLIDMTWEVKSVKEDGSARIAQTIDRMRMYMDGPNGSRFEFDSKLSAEPAGSMLGIAKMIKGIVGLPIELTMSPRGEVSDVTVSDRLLQALKMPGPNGQAVGGLFSEETFKNMASQGSIVFPAEALTPGKTWTATKTVDTPVVGKMTIDTLYTYAGPAAVDAPTPGLEQIDAALDVKIEPAPNAQVQANVEEQENSARFLFDSKRGVLTSSQVKQRMKLSLTAMGQKFLQEVSSTVSMRLAGPEAK